MSGEGKRVNASFVGFDSATGLSLLEADEPFINFGGDVGHTEEATVGQRVHLFAPAQVGQPGGDEGSTEVEETIYLDMGRTEGELTEVRRAPSGRPARVTARAPRVSPAWAGAVATSESGTPLGIVALSGAQETQIVPVEVVRAAVERVRATRAGIVPQPWLGVRGYATSQMPLGTWVDHGWKPEAAMPLIQSRKGVFLTSIAPGSPAALSGLRNGDVLARTGERDINGIEDLTMLLKEAGVGSTVSFKVWRAGAAAPLDFSAVLSGARSPALATAEAEMRAARGRVSEVRSVVNATHEEERRLREQRIAVERYSGGARRTRRAQAAGGAPVDARADPARGSRDAHRRGARATDEAGLRAAGDRGRGAAATPCARRVWKWSASRRAARRTSARRAACSSSPCCRAAPPSAAACAPAT